MRIIPKILPCIVFILLFSCIKSFGQYDQAMLDSNYRFNVSFCYTAQNFYHGNSFEFDNPFDKSSKYLKIPFRYRNGISISYRATSKSSFILKATKTSYSYERSYENRHKYKKGDLLGRGITLYTLKYRQSLLRDIKLNIQVTGGITHRRGVEAYLLNYYYYELHIHQTPLEDFGASFGLSAYRDILKSRLRLRASLTHTEFIYRYDTGDKTDYEWDDGSNKRMFQFTFSIGYNFGQIPFKE